MKSSHLAALALLAFPVPASASVVTFGAGYAESCWRAAEARNPHRISIKDCDRALGEQALTSADRVATHVNRGVLHLIRADVRSANADFDAALAIDPRQAEAWLNKAVVHARFGKSSDALPFVVKALEFGTRKPALAYFVRAMAAEDSGDLVAAYRDLKRAQALDPKWEEPEIELRRFQVRSSARG